MRALLRCLLPLTLVVVGCNPSTPTTDAGMPDAAPGPDAPGRDAGRDANVDSGPTNCTEDCHALEDQCHVAHCNESAGLCVIEDGSGACDDGDPCTTTDQCLVGACVGFATPGCCTADCSGATCGDDGCGGSCGSCGVGMLCGGARTCVTGTAAGDTCAAPTEITSLPFTRTSTTTALTNDLAVPFGACSAGGGFGDSAPDAVFRYHPTHDGVILVTLSGLGFTAGAYATTDCTDLRHACSGALYPFMTPTLGPLPVDVHAGLDVFIVVDGDGTESGTFTITVDGCTPDCAGAQCGNDGCGRNCDAQCPITLEWNCSTARTCVCEPSCSGRTCGTDGCSGTCGSCGAGLACDAHGACVSSTLPGDTATSAIPITTPTFTYSGTTVGYGNDATSWASCAGGSGAYYGLDAPDVMFSLAPAVTTTYYLSLASSGFIPAMYAVRDPSDILSCVEARYEPFTARQQLLIEASAASPLFVVVDGDSNGAGPFTISARACHTAADCPDASEGEFCSFPLVVTGLPFDQTDFIGSLDAYRTAAGTCGVPYALGVDGRDTVYAYHATTSGSVTVRAQGIGQLDPILVVTTDCGAIDTSCVAAVDHTGENGLETVTFAATAGTTYFVIVDSYGPLGGQVHLTMTSP